MSNEEIHEERPKAQAAKRVRKDGEYEYILVQVTPNDSSAGDDKAVRLQRDGWAKVDALAEPDKVTGVENYFYMKRPRAALEEDRRNRTDRWRSLMRAPLAGSRPAGVAPGTGSAITDVADVEALSPQEEQALGGLAAMANS
jgi:hypothetical protein